MLNTQQRRSEAIYFSRKQISVFSKKAFHYYKYKIQNHPIGTGPFRLLTSNQHERVYVRNENYWRYDEHNNQLPFLDKIRVKYQTTNEGFSSFTTQKTDLLLSIPANEINSLFGTLDEAKNGKNILHKFQFRNGLKINYIGFNCHAPPFNDIHLRKAIFHAVDREQICRRFLYGESNPAENGILPIGAYFQPTHLPQKAFNMNLARYHLRKSKYRGDTIVFFANVKEGSPEKKWVKNYEIKFHKIKYEERTGQSKLKFKDFFKFLYTIFSLLFYYKPFKILIPLILPIFLAFIIFLIQDIYSGNLTDKTVLLFNFNFLSIILLFIIDRINKLK